MKNKFEHFTEQEVCQYKMLPELRQAIKDRLCCFKWSLDDISRELQTAEELRNSSARLKDYNMMSYYWEFEEALMEEITRILNINCNFIKLCRGHKK